MSKQTLNIHQLDKFMNYNSLDTQDNVFPVTVFFGAITMEQAEHIIKRSHILYERMETLHQKIADLYGKEQTETLMNNFDDIISYSDKVLGFGTGETFDEYFEKLESFCGQIENIIKMIRYYYALFDSNS